MGILPLEATPQPDPHDGHTGSGSPAMPGIPMDAGPVQPWSWQPDWFWLTFALVLLAAYLVGVIALTRRGVRWSPARTTNWLLGVLTILAATCSGAARLGASQLSWHMYQHMTLSMLSPILLLLGSPITLALRALPATGRGAPVRKTLLRLLHSRFTGFVTHPGFTIPLFFGSLYGLYFSPALDALMASHIGHQFMLAHFLITGTAFFLPLIATDPIPNKLPPGVRLALLAFAVPLHAFFGVILTMSPEPISEHFAYATTAAGYNPQADQHLAGGFAWAFGEIPTLFATLIIFGQWLRHDRNQADRHDREADRSHDAELQAYNQHLAELNRRPSAGA